MSDALGEQEVYDCAAKRATFAGLLDVINQATKAAAMYDFSRLGERRGADAVRYVLALQAINAGHYDCLASENGCVAMPTTDTAAAQPVAA